MRVTNHINKSNMKVKELIEAFTFMLLLLMWLVTLIRKILH